jgi:4a-hydroxytetrahydrobiopterin dehydratase
VGEVPHVVLRVGSVLSSKEDAVTALDSNQRGEFLSRNPGWALEGETIRKTFEFSDFNGAMGFVVRVALLAETANHHPDIDIRWNKVTIALSTHSAGALTAKDTDVAGQIEAL